MPAPPEEAPVEPEPKETKAEAPEPKSEAGAPWDDFGDDVPDEPRAAEQSASMWGDVGEDEDAEEWEEESEPHHGAELDDAWDQLEALDPNESDEAPPAGQADTLVAEGPKKQTATPDGDTWMQLPPVQMPAVSAPPAEEDAALAATAASQRALGPEDLNDGDGAGDEDPALAPTYEQSAVSQAEMGDYLAQIRGDAPATAAQEETASLWGDEAEEEDEDEASAAATAFAQPVLSKEDLARLVAEKAAATEAEEAPEPPAEPAERPDDEDDPLSGLPRAPEGGLLIAPSGRR